ncbi:MAG: AMP-binding protein [Acidimicrobiia bacterium]|nr:AMP-binding protein [Acidimicrobiia bacterium]
MLAVAPTRRSLLVDGDWRLSSVELNHLTACVAGGLRAAGVRRRDAVAWQLPNCWQAVVLYRACWRLGAVATPVHNHAGPADVEAVLGQVGPRLAVDPTDLDALVAAPPLAPSFRPARPADPAVILFTSGSSGSPKAAIHTHRGLAHKARLMLDVHGLARKDAVLMPAPLAHVSGLLNGVLIPGASGMRTVLQARWDPDAALRLIEDERVSFMIGPPTFFVGLRDAPTFSPAAVKSLRLVSCGGAGVTADFVKDTADALGCRVKRTYGSTEAPTVATAHVDDGKKAGRRTDGRPTGEVELRIEPSSGELLVRGPEVFAGYTDPVRTGTAFARGGWFRTGDRGIIDDGGWLTITGRLKDLIIRGGENIATAEVEAVCEAHPVVRHAVAVGELDRRLGERVVVFVVLRPGAEPGSFDRDACRAWFEARGVARFKTPERVEVLENLPTLPAGKADREAVRRLV